MLHILPAKSKDDEENVTSGKEGCMLWRSTEWDVMFSKKNL